jgi:hypothetical protein
MKSWSARRRLRRMIHERGPHCERCGEFVMVSKTAKHRGYRVEQATGEIWADDHLIGFIATIEHVVPRCKGGSNDDDNLAVFCEPCNRETNPELLQQTLGSCE